MKTVWKWQLPLAPEFELPMPQDAVVLHVREQFNHACLWAEVDPERPVSARKFSWATTGNGNMPEGLRWYRGTALLHGGSLVLHLYERLGTQEH